MLSRILPVKLLPQQNETYRTPFSFENNNIFTRVGETENSYINSSGNISTSSNYCLSDYIEVEECKRYVFDASMVNLTSGVYHAFYDDEKTRLAITSATQEGFIPPTGAKYVRLSYRKDANATDFHISIGTVPHGTLDVKTGILTVDYAFLSDLSIYFFSRVSATYTYIFVSMPMSNMKVPTESSGRLEGIASSGYRISNTEGVNASMTHYSMLRNNGRLYFRNDDYNDDAVSFRASLSGQQAIYELVSPCTYQLTPQEVHTLLGYNKITSNATKLQFTYLNDNNETIALTGDNEYIIDDGVFNRSPSTVNQIFEPKQDLHGYDYPWPPGGGGNLMNIGDIELLKDPDLIHINSTRTGFYGIDEDLASMFNGDEWGYIPILGQDTLNPVGIEYDTPYTLYFRAYTDAEESTSGIGLKVTFYDESGTRISSIKLKNSYTSEQEFSYTTFDPNRGEPGYTLGGITIEGGSGLCGNTWHFEFMTLAEGTSYLPYSNICPIEGHTESILTVEGTPVPDSESERRLKAITRPVFQWDFGLKLKFEGYAFADGTLCQFDNKLTTFSQNEYIVNNECTIPASLLDENCQGDIVAHINVSGNDYDVVVYEVYIPVIKRAKPENFLRPAIDLPSAVVASFADGADGVPLEKLNLPLLPKQDLHGYDYPWVGGGGKNKFPQSIVSGTLNVNVTFGLNSGVYTISAIVSSTDTDDTENLVYFHYIDETWEAVYLGRSTQRTSVTVTLSKAVYEIRFYAAKNYAKSVGDSFSFSDIQIEEGSSPTSYAPYSNICPITGYTEANVTRTGKNLFDLNYLTATGITITDGVVSGTAATFHTNFGGTAGGVPIPVLPQGQLTLSFDVKTDGNASTSGNGIVVRFHYTDNTWTGIMKANNATDYSHEIMTSTANKVVDYIYISYSSTGSNLWYFKNIQLESASSATAYEPYKGEVFTIPFTHEGPNVFTTEGATLDRYINGNGQEASSSNYRITAYIPVEPNKRYVYDANNARFSTSVYHAYFDANKQLITSVHAMQEGFYIPSGIYYVRLSYRKDEVPTDFHISIGTVPHGMLDIKTGILTQDYAFVSDMSNMYWRVSSSTYPGIYRTDYYLGNIYGPTTASGRIRGFSCSCYKPMEEDHAGSGSNSTPYAMMRYNGALFIRNDDYNNDATSFKASLAGQQVVYELDRESPAIYQLTPTEVKTLLGYNNIWADTGEVEVSYYPDPYLHFET